MTMQQGSDYFELADYVGVLRRRWLMVVTLTLAGIVLAGGYYYVAPRTYAATVLVQVNALQNNANALGGRTSGPVNMDNEGQIAQSATVAAIVKSKLHSPLTVTGLLKNVKVAVPPNTTFLQITCAADTADLAERCANAFGRAYLYNRRATALGLISSGITALNAQAAALETSIEQLKQKVGRRGLPAGSAARGVAELQLSAKLARLSTIQSKINSATPLEANLSSKNTAVGQIVTPAVKPFAPVSPKKKLLLPSGLAAGLLIGLVLAFFWDWRRPRIQTARDVQRRADLPTVFDLTELKGRRRGGLSPRELVVESGAHTVFAPPRSPTGQLFTELAQYVGAALGDGHHVVLVAGAGAESGGGPVAANLASALARSRGETVLICADPQGAAIPRMAGTVDGRGFAELLAGSAAVADVTRRTADQPLLRVITPGLDAAGAVYDMRHDRVQRIMRDLRREVRYVVIDVPPPSLDADTFSVAEFADAAVLAVGAGTARPSDVTDCVQRLERIRTAVLAAVLVPPANRRPAGRGRRFEAADSSEIRAPQPRPVQPYSQPEGRYSQPEAPYPPPRSHQSQPRSLPRDEAASTSQPVIRPVAGRRSSGSTGPSNGGSRHAAPSRHSDPTESADPGSSARTEGPFSGAWTPRSVSETWPLPQTGPAEQGEEAGLSDPLIGN